VERRCPKVWLFFSESSVRFTQSSVLSSVFTRPSLLGTRPSPLFFYTTIEIPFTLRSSASFVTSAWQRLTIAVAT
jgi:hypothetical protein